MGGENDRVAGDIDRCGNRKGGKEARARDGMEKGVFREGLWLMRGKRKYIRILIPDLCLGEGKDLDGIKSA